MSDENATTDDGPRNLVQELLRRRRRIVRAQGTLSELANAYALVSRDISRSAASRESGLATRDEPSAA
jgi:hypothetical protein